MGSNQPQRQFITAMPPSTPVFEPLPENIALLLGISNAATISQAPQGMTSEVAFVNDHGAKVIGVDKSLTMCHESRARGLTLSIVGSAEDLPLRSGLVDGCWSDRTFQHPANPQGALAELLRVRDNRGRGERLA